MTNTPGDTELLTTDEVIDLLLADANLRSVAATCVLPAVRYGEDWRFRRADLDEWIRVQLLNGPQGTSGAGFPAD